MSIADYVKTSLAAATNEDVRASRRARLRALFPGEPSLAGP